MAGRVCMLFLVSKLPDKSLHPQHSSLWDYAMIKSKNIKKLFLKSIAELLNN